MAGNDDVSGPIGPRKAAMLMRAIGEDRKARLFSRMSDEDISNLAKATARLGTIDAQSMEGLLSEFADKLEGGQTPAKPSPPARPVPESPEETPQTGTRPGLLDFEA